MVDLCQWTWGLLAVVGLSGQVAGEPKSPSTDRYGDPLPKGAVARLGTAQLRAGSESVCFSADGKTLIAADRRLIRVWDAADGRLRETHRLPGSEFSYPCRSPDGNTILFAEQTNFELWDVPSRKRLAGPQKVGERSIGCCAISNDRRWGLFALDLESLSPVESGVEGKPLPYQLILRDMTAGTNRVLSESERKYHWLEFSRDGKRAVSSGVSSTRVWDVATGKFLWEVRNQWVEEPHFTPDGKYLILSPGGGGNPWRVLDAENGKPSTTHHPPTVDKCWMFEVSPDGNSLFLPTETECLVWDLKAGEVRHRWPSGTARGRGAFAPDGKSVVTYDTTLCRWDLATGKNLYADVASKGHVALVWRVFFAPDGKRLIAVGGDQTARVWDVATSRLLRTIPLELDITDACWAMSPDGTMLVAVDKALAVHCWPLTAEGPRKLSELLEAQNLKIGLRATDIQVLADGTLAMMAWPLSPVPELYKYSFSFWDLTTGRLVRWGGDPARDPASRYRGEWSRLAPGARLAGSAQDLYDTRTGAMHKLTAATAAGGVPPLFSPDGRLVAGYSSDTVTRVWEAATGRVFADLPGGLVIQGAFGPDGRWLACAERDRLNIWDVSSSRIVAAWPYPNDIPPQYLWVTAGPVSSPDERTIATGQMDGTILLWQVPVPDPGKRWSEAEAANLWDDLRDDTPAKAYAAIRQFADYAENAVRLLKEKYPLIPPAGPDEWKKLIVGLDSPKFAEREAASKRLLALGRAAEQPLRQALKADPTPEQLPRIKALLAELDAPLTCPRGEELRSVRAVAVLEACGTPEARRLLTDWAERGSSLRLSDESARAVERLKWRP
jgi:WD40 repeat protein